MALSAPARSTATVQNLTGVFLDLTKTAAIENAEAIVWLLSERQPD